MHSGALLINYSQGIRHEKYSKVEVVAASEIVKLILSSYLSMTAIDEANSTPSKQVIRGWKWLQSILFQGKKVLVLVVMYNISNVLTYFSLERIGAPTFTVISQLKTLTTAIFAVLFLNKTISHTKWRALILLVLGCTLVSSPIILAYQDTEAADTWFEELLGLTAAMVMVVLSGLCSVYFEGILKGKDETLNVWDRNVQMSAYSIIVLFIVVMAQRYYAEVMEITDSSAILSGWTPLAVLIVFVQAIGGLLVAATLKYADSVLKCFATAISIVIATIVGHFAIGTDIDIIVVIGMICTILSLFNYTFEETVDR